MTPTIPGIIRKRFSTESGQIVYFAPEQAKPNRPWLFFLPGLTADHRLFDLQMEHFAPLANCLTWDPPAHGLSRPYPLDFTVESMAQMVHGILETEGASRPVLVGQSMGGYVSQAFLTQYPNQAAGFVSIDSAPLCRSYYTAAELAMLNHTRLMYLSIPWKSLVNMGASGCATTVRGQNLMRRMMADYDRVEFCNLAAYGYWMLGRAVRQNGERTVECPTLILCGRKDAAGSTRRYNEAWERKEGRTVTWVDGAGHNSNTDKPQFVNHAIQDFLVQLGFELA